MRYYRWDQNPSNPSFWSPPPSAKKRQSAPPVEQKTTSFSKPYPKLNLSGFDEKDETKERVKPVSALPPSSLPKESKKPIPRPIGPSSTTTNTPRSSGIFTNQPAMKRMRELGTTGITTSALMEMVVEQNERIDKLANDLEKEREARASLERKVLSLKEKLIVANVIH